MKGSSGVTTAISVVLVLAITVPAAVPAETKVEWDARRVERELLSAQAQVAALSLPTFFEFRFES